MRIDIPKSDGTSISLYPLDEYLSHVLFDHFVLIEDFTRSKELSDKHNGSLTLVGYKPMATFSLENSQGYMPFIIQMSTSPKEYYSLGYPARIEVGYGEKAVYLKLGKLSRAIKAYDFTIRKRIARVNIMQGTTVKDFAFDVIILSDNYSVDPRFEDERALAKKKIKELIQMLESAIPTIREDFKIEYKFYSFPYNTFLYPYIILVPKGIVNEISDFLLSLYQQNYGIVTKLPAEFTPNENVQSPELQKFLEKLPLDLIAEAVVGTYGSSPVVLLPEGDYSQYLTGNEYVNNLGKNVMIVFGNSQEQQTPALEQQNKVEENSNTEQNKVEKVPNNAIAERLGKEIQSIYESIIEDYFIDSEEKKNRLEKLNSVLNELGRAILDALKSQIPLDANQIRKYAEDIAKNGGLSYINNFEYYIGYYENHLTTSAKLEILVMLLHSIGNIMYDIGKTIKEYNSLQLTY